VDEVIAYSRSFWENKEDLADHDRIMKKINNAEDKRNFIIKAD